MLKNLDVLNDKDINKYIDMAIQNKNEEFLIYIYELKYKICNKTKIIKPFELILNLLELNFYKMSKIIYKEYVTDENIEKDYKHIKKIVNTMLNKGELHLIKFINKITPKIFLEFYTDIVITSIQQGYLDIFDYVATILNIKEIDNEDKLDLLEIALYTNNEDIFEIIFDIIKPVDLTYPHLKILELSKEINKEIFSFLYTEQDNQIRGY